MSRAPEQKNPAFRVIYNRYHLKVYRYCHRVMDNASDAEDIFQETFIRFYKSVDNNSNINNVLGYLLKIARHQCLNEKTRNSRVFVDIDSLNLGSMDDKIEKDEYSAMLKYALSLLPDDQREALVLQTYNELSYAEIAGIMEVPVTTVRNWIVRAKRKVRGIMQILYKS